MLRQAAFPVDNTCPSDDQLCECIRDLAWLASVERAQSPGQLELKAAILLELIGDETDDICDQLTRSLCADILRTNENRNAIDKVLLNPGRTGEIRIMPGVRRSRDDEVS